MIEFPVELGENGKETLQLLQEAYVPEAMSRLTVFGWWKHFKESKRKVVDDTWSGRKSVADVDVPVEQTNELMVHDGKFILWIYCQGSAHYVIEIGHILIVWNVHFMSSNWWPERNVRVRASFPMKCDSFATSSYFISSILTYCIIRAASPQGYFGSESSVMMQGLM